MRKDSVEASGDGFGHRGIVKQAPDPREAASARGARDSRRAKNIHHAPERRVRVLNVQARGLNPALTVSSIICSVIRSVAV